MEKIIEIPEGYEARIEGNKVVLEPKESEDERIRKWLIEMVKELRKANPTNAEHNGNCSEAIAYLEKLKEQKPIISAEESLGISQEEYNEIVDECIYGKQKERKPTEYDQEYREEDLQTRFAFYTYKDEPNILYLSNLFVEESSRGAHFGTRILKGAERLAEAVGASTIRLKVKQDSPANAWYRKNGYGYMTFEEDYDWLEKNLEYLKPEKPAGWSEEDERNLTDAISAIEHLKNDCDWGYLGIGNDIDNVLNFLESLPKRFSLQPHWKPSKDQIQALYNILQDPKNAGSISDRTSIVGLIHDLEKLV